MLQGWYNVTQIHWAFDPSIVQRLLPYGFTVDTFDGKAWVGLIPFHMRRIRLPFGPRDGLAAGRYSTFPETNVRTYIIDSRGRRGVWFFSLDINRMVPTLIARLGYGLPYCCGSMTITADAKSNVEVQGSVVTYGSTRNWPRATHRAAATSDMAVRIGERLEPSEPNASITHFLTARWALGSTFLRRLLWAEVDHQQWPLHSAELLRCDETLIFAAGLPAPQGEPHVVWSPGVEVRIGRPRLISAYV